MTKNARNIKNLSMAALCLALAMVLPFATGQIPQLGSMLCPMHIPVLLCGFICGPFYALIVGLIAPVLRFLLFGMPPIFPTGLAMCFELACYGLVAGLLYRALPKKTGNIYIALLVAMLVGRIVWGVATMIILGISGSGLTWAAFISSAFINSLPGIILHILIIPPIVMALCKAKLCD